MKAYPIKSKSHLEGVLGFSINEINAIVEDLKKNRCDTHLYYSFIRRTKKKNGKLKEREITPAKCRLSYLQDRINDRILARIPLPAYIHGGRKKHDAISNGKEHKGKNNHFCTDLKDFFPYVSSKKVYNAFIALEFAPDIAHILARVVTFQGHLPQGASTSTAIANIVFYFEIGRPLEEILRGRNITLTTYVDDLSLSTQEEFDGIDNLVLAQILRAGFRYNHQKTVKKKGKIDITGVEVGRNKIQATASIKRKLDEPDRSQISKAGVQNYINRIEKVDQSVR